MKALFKRTSIAEEWAILKEYLLQTQKMSNT